jgi:hypothetical protein
VIGLPGRRVSWIGGPAVARRSRTDLPRDVRSSLA